MTNALTSFRAAEMDATLHGGVVGEKRAFAAMLGNPFASEVEGKMVMIQRSAPAPKVRAAATFGM